MNEYHYVTNLPPQILRGGGEKEKSTDNDNTTTREEMASPAQTKKGLNTIDIPPGKLGLTIEFVSKLHSALSMDIIKKYLRGWKI